LKKGTDDMLQGPFPDVLLTGTRHDRLQNFLVIGDRLVSTHFYLACALLLSSPWLTGNVRSAGVLSADSAPFSAGYILEGPHYHQKESI
jgi:hypothetical protein